MSKILPQLSEYANLDGQWDMHAHRNTQTSTTPLFTNYHLELKSRRLSSAESITSKSRVTTSLEYLERRGHSENKTQLREKQGFDAKSVSYRQFFNLEI